MTPKDVATWASPVERLRLAEPLKRSAFLAAYCPSILDPATEADEHLPDEVRIEYVVKDDSIVFYEKGKLACVLACSSPPTRPK